VVRPSPLGGGGELFPLGARSVATPHVRWRQQFIYNLYPHHAFCRIMQANWQWHATL
jgi:hypothetical protein